MRNHQNMTIAVLSLSAAVLLGVLFWGTSTQEAAANASESRAGNYIMVPAEHNSRLSVVYVVDVGGQRMNTYRLDRQDREIQMVSTLDLAQAFAAGVLPRQ